MVVAVTNAQRQASVRVGQVDRFARQAIRQLRLRARGTMAITLISGQRMRRLNRRALGHNRPTDVLTFRYDGEPIIGDILIAPAAARAYAKAHGLAYEEELCRYVVHGLLHWMGHEDATPAQRRAMRALENHLLMKCGMRHAVCGVTRSHSALRIPHSALGC